MTIVIYSKLSAKSKSDALVASGYKNSHKVQSEIDLIYMQEMGGLVVL
jgi:hypothetical protein